MTDLKPCPFCGDKASTRHIRDGREVWCRGCGAAGSPKFHGPLNIPPAEDRAIAAWNRRAPTPEAATLIKAEEALSPLAAMAAKDARIRELEEALSPFSKMAGELFVTNYNREDLVYCRGGSKCTAGDFFTARAELDTTQTQLGDWIVRADEANVKVETLDAELARVRADAQAAVARAYEAAAERLDLAEHDAEERDWRSGANAFAALAKGLRALAPADGLAAVDALRAEIADLKMNMDADLRTMVREGQQLRTLAAELAAAQQREAALTKALEACVASLERVDTAEGVCCCGDSMDRHSDPMSCGHSPVDMGDYYAGQALESARAVLQGEK